MERHLGLLLLGSLCSSVLAVIDPRGPRPVEPGTKADQCATQKEWAFCSDEDWGPKCPSGCRVLGLMDKHDHEILTKINHIRTLLEKNQAQHGSTDRLTKQTYDYLRDRLTSTSGSDFSYQDMSQKLRRRIVDIKIKIDRQLRSMSNMKDSIKRQVSEMQRLEVDVDIKLRGCKGSCKTYAQFSVDSASYIALDKQMAQLEAEASQSVVLSRTIHVMKARVLKEAQVVSSVYKSKLDQVEPSTSSPFQEVASINLILMEEGSTSSTPATVSKDQGTSSFANVGTGVGEHGSTSITEISSPWGGTDTLGGLGGFGSEVHSSKTSETTTSCSKSTRTIVTPGPSGPVETTEEVIEGGPACHTMMDSTKGMAFIFPTLERTKGVLDTKTGFVDSGFDLGGFVGDNPEDDHPDVHARSLKSITVNTKTASYVGKDCADILQHHKRGELSGVFEVRLGQGPDSRVVQVYCDQSGFMGGWLLIQQRESGQLNFNRSWAEYRQGFGSVDAQGRGELWLGNRQLHLLTNRSESMLRVELEDWEGGVAMAQYSIKVASEREGFRLEVRNYEGDAGDGLASHSGRVFSSFDRDQEGCAARDGGGWWQHRCPATNLNGLYGRGADRPTGGVVWAAYRPAHYSLKRVRMSIRPAAF